MEWIAWIFNPEKHKLNLRLNSFVIVIPDHFWFIVDNVIEVLIEILIIIDNDCGTSVVLQRLGTFSKNAYVQSIMLRAQEASAIRQRVKHSQLTFNPSEFHMLHFWGWRELLNWTEQRSSSQGGPIVYEVAIVSVCSTTQKLYVIHSESRKKPSK